MNELNLRERILEYAAEIPGKYVKVDDKLGEVTNDEERGIARDVTRICHALQYDAVDGRGYGIGPQALIAFDARQHLAGAHGLPDGLGHR